MQDDYFVAIIDTDLKQIQIRIAPLCQAKLELELKAEHGLSHAAISKRFRFTSPYLTAAGAKNAIPKKYAGWPIAEYSRC
jgi:hypothetical protein